MSGEISNTTKWYRIYSSAHIFNYDLTIEQSYVHLCHFNLFQPFRCETCLRFFGRKDHLKQHVAVVHLGIKRFWCNMCSYRASCKGNLNSHIKSNHRHVIKHWWTLNIFGVSIVNVFITDDWCRFRHAT